jgi:hypothetical protein
LRVSKNTLEFPKVNRTKRKRRPTMTKGKTMNDPNMTDPKANAEAQETEAREAEAKAAAAVEADPPKPEITALTPAKPATAFDQLSAGVAREAGAPPEFVALLERIENLERDMSILKRRYPRDFVA